ncbi:MAG: preprotein translocase subunit SecG, partial [Bacteroidia bacterium]|nr:preprotein translocase subunit SecG [Bacteroidia bacterium]
LVQNSKGGGLASGFSSSAQIMGVRKTTDLLEKLTWGFGIALFVLSILGSFSMPTVVDTNSPSSQESIIQKQLDNSAGVSPGVLPQDPPPPAPTTTPTE